MTRVPKIIPSLAGGVSQQPPALRFPGQVEESLNTWHSLVDGAAKRAPTNHIAKLITDLPDNAAYQLIERDGDDYVLVLTDRGPSSELPGIRVFDLEGTEYLVTDDGAVPTGPERVPTHYTGNSPDNYIGDWQQIGLGGAWITNPSVDRAGAAATAVVGPLGTDTAVELWDDNGATAGDGLWETWTNTVFGPKSLVVAVYTKKKDGMDSFRFDVRNTTQAVTYSASFAWSGLDLVTSGTPSVGYSYVEDIGDDWWRAVYVIDVTDYELDADLPLPGDVLNVVRLALVEASTGTPKDYFWGMTLNFVDDDGDVTTPPPIKNEFGPFRFLTLADATFVLNTQWITRGASALTQSHEEWLPTIPATSQNILHIDILKVISGGGAYTWSITNDAGTHTGSVPSTKHAPWSAALLAIDIAGAHSSLADTFQVGGYMASLKVTAVSTTEITAFEVTKTFMAAYLDQVDDILLVRVLDGQVTDYDWSVTNGEGTFAGTYTALTTNKTTTATGITAAIAAADASLAGTTSSGSLITVRSVSTITSHTFEPILLDAYDEFVGDVAYIFVQQGLSGADYSWEVVNGSGEWSGSITATDSNTTAIADQIVADIVGTDASFAKTARIGSVVEIQSLSPITKLQADDDGGDTLVSAFHTEVEVISDLPLTLRDGYRVKVSADPTASQDDYFVVFNTTSGEPTGPGLWRESTDWGVLEGVDGASMPHQLQLQTDTEGGDVTGTPFATYFTFGQADWVPREVGNAETNPDPSFVGKAISELLFTANRFGFLSDANTILSEAGVYFNFWRTTMVAVPDSDPIDIAVNEPKLATLRSANALDEQLIVSSSHAQFVLSGTPVTPSTAILEKISSYRVANLRPAAAGKILIFPTPGTDYSGALDFFQINAAEGVAFSAEETSQAVPKYILGAIEFLTAVPGENLVLFRATTANLLYVYRYAIAGDQRVQSAWSKWEFGDSSSVEYVDFLEGRGVLLIERDGDLFLETIEIGDGLVDTGQNLRVHLDRRVRDTACSMAYSAGNDKTTVTLPYDLDPAATVDDVAVVALDGVEYTLDSVGTDTIVVYGDLTSDEFWAGERYTQSLTLSEPVPQRDGPTGPIPLSGRYIIADLDLQVAGTGAFTLTHTYGGQDYVHQFTGQTVGGLEVDSGEVVLFTDNRKIGVMAPASGLSTVLSNSTALPSRFTGLVWNGNLSKHA